MLMTLSGASANGVASRKPRACPICFSHQRKKIHDQVFEAPTRNAVHCGYAVVVCDRCGFGFADGIPDQRFFDEYYRSISNKASMLNVKDGFLEGPHTIKRHEVSLNAILPYIHSGDRVLDVGAFTGHFLALLKQAVPSIDPVGIDPDSFAANIAKERHAIEVVVGTIFDDFQTRTFDMTIISHVLEHVVDLQSFLGKVFQYVADDGLVYVEVPDASRFFITPERDDLNALGMSEPYFQFNFEHINYFTPRSLQNLMRRNGFIPLSIEQRDSILPVVASVWKPCAIERATDTDPALRRYVAQSNDRSKRLESVLADIGARSVHFAVWGAGAHTQRLLGCGTLRPDLVKFFVDSNEDYWGATLAGKTIFSPAVLREMPDVPVVISSFSYETDIAKTITAAGYKNEIVGLYNEF
jgi:SAM-dependent methyltransferase